MRVFFSGSSFPEIPFRKFFSRGFFMESKAAFTAHNSPDPDEVRALEVLSDCRLCPRDCRVNRVKGERGFCGEAGMIRAARAALYYTEEPVISGSRGSGTVFFSGCSLGCIYCQNRRISRARTSSGSGEL